MLKSLRPHVPSTEEVAPSSQTADGDAESGSESVSIYALSPRTLLLAKGYRLPPLCIPPIYFWYGSGGHDAPSLDDPPAKRLEWCISRLEDAGTGAINSNTFAEEQV